MRPVHDFGDRGRLLPGSFRVPRRVAVVRNFIRFGPVCAQVQALEQHMERLAEMFSTTTAGRGGTMYLPGRIGPFQRCFGGVDYINTFGSLTRGTIGTDRVSCGPGCSRARENAFLRFRRQVA